MNFILTGSWRKVKDAAVSVAIQHGVKVALGALGRKRRSLDDVNVKAGQQIDNLQPSNAEVSTAKEQLLLSTQKQAARISEDSKSPLKAAEFGSSDNEKELHNHNYNVDDDDTASYFLEQSTSNGGISPIIPRAFCQTLAEGCSASSPDPFVVLGSFPM